MDLDEFIKTCAIIGEGVVLTHHFVWRRRR